jgi:TPR repeat protein
MERISRKQWQALAKSAKSGDAAAQWDFGYYCENGAISKSGEVLSPQSNAEASRWYLCAANQNYAAAMVSLSNILSAGDHPDYKAAMSWAKSAIELGEASAAYNLGIIYRDLGKPREALRHYQLAASMGDCEAHLQIGLCSLFGQGAATDPAAAAQNFQQVLKAPSEAISPRARENAQYWLGLLAARGLGQSRSLARARKLLELANADDDHEQANNVLNVIGRSSKLRLRQGV